MRDKIEKILKDNPINILHNGIYVFDVINDYYHAHEDELAVLMTKEIDSQILDQWALFKQEFWDEVRDEVSDEKDIVYIGAGKDNAFKDFPNNLFINLDLVRSNLEDLKSNGAKFCLQADLRNLPFVSGSLDVVVIVDLIHHFKTRGLDQVLYEVSRVLKPGGKIYLAEINKYAFFRLPYSFFPHLAIRILREIKSLFVKKYHKPESYEGPLSMDKVVQKARHFGLIWAKEYTLRSYPEIKGFNLRIWRLLSKIKRIRRKNGFHWFIRLDKLDEKEGV